MAKRKKVVDLVSSPPQPSKRLKDIGKTSNPDVDGSTSSSNHDGFTLFVGPTRRRITAPTILLRKYPVFARMVDGNFQESNTRVIELPEDSFENICVMLRFLHTREIPEPKIWLCGYGCLENPERSKVYQDFGDRCLELYYLGDKYLLPDFVDKLTDKLINVRMDRKPIVFFRLFQDIMNHTVTTDWTREYFEDHTRHALQKASPEQKDLIFSQLKKSGGFAAALFKMLQRILEIDADHTLRIIERNERQRETQTRRHRNKINLAHNVIQEMQRSYFPNDVGVSSYLADLDEELSMEDSDGKVEGSDRSDDETETSCNILLSDGFDID
ncbi:hypothetical protein MMC25_007663 [Agyrium rufum]|nr:hypothetical protein [Agyrium rufum]